jgi:large subunit ribosomal protein MRP49
MWQAQRQHPYLAFGSPLFSIPIADLPRLYEGWCAIQVARTLLALGGEVREQRLVERGRPATEDDDLELAVTLVEDAPLLVIERGQQTLTLRYQPKYRPLRGRMKAEGRRMKEQAGGPSSFILHPSSFTLGSLDRHTRVPDLAIEVCDAGEPPRALLLDAKYRLDAEGRGVPQDALDDAYAYLGAIGYAQQRATIGALLLYPGASKPERYPSGVGAVPLLPDRTASLLEVLKEWLPS